MSHQINFFVTPSDVEDLESALRGSHRAQFFFRRSSSKEPLPTQSLRVRDANGDQELSYDLCKEGDVDKLVMNAIPSRNEWSVDVSRSPAVEFASSYFDGHILRRGRMYYVDSYYDGDVLVSKSAAFREWAAALLVTTRKKLRRHGRDYIGPDAARWLREDEGKLEAL